MKKSLLFLFALVFSLSAFAQGSLYSDDFESYNVGDYIAESNPTWWTTWGAAPGTGEDATISDTYASSPTKSVFIDPDDGLTDLVLKLGNKTSGAFEVDWHMYVPSGYQGYYNFQHFESPGVEWAFDVWYYDDGSGEIMVGNVTYPFTYPVGAWFLVEHDINIDADEASLTVNGVTVHTWPFSYQTQETTGTNQLGGVDFWTDDATYKFYIDDVNYAPMPSVLYEDDFESYDVGDYIAESNPTWWATWGGAPGTGEDATISDTYGNSPTQSVFVDPDDGLTDLILKLGNKTSGAYNVNWYMYVPSGYQGYYNFQHFESPGVEWAFDVWFYDDASGEIMVGNVTYPFSFPIGSWFSVEHMINIDEDQATLYVNGVEVHTWPFSYQTQETTGTNQLGGVDFWTDDATYKFYVDDVEFTQMGTSTEPSIEVSPENISATAGPGSMVTVPLTITNNGSADLTYDINVLYPMPGLKNLPATTLEGKPVQHRSLGYVDDNSTDPNYKPAAYNPVKDEFMLNYDGDNANSFSWGPNAPYTIVNAAMFPPELTLPHAGMMVTSVIMYFNEVGENHRVRIYGSGDGFKPGAMLVDQPFTPQEASWNEVVLDEPVYIDGGEIWVGYQYTQPVLDNYIPGVDEGPNNINGDWLSFGGVVWNHLTDYDDNVNWNIRAMLTGDPIEQWLSAAPLSGTVAPGESATINVTCDASALEVGTYEGLLHITNNDNDNPMIDVPVTFEVGNLSSIILDFEEQADWSLTFDPWTAVDIDGSSTWGIDGVTFPHSGEPMAFIAFNPATTTPAMTDEEIQPHGGVRFGACMASADPTYLNDDWLISPQVTLGMNSNLNFWVKSYTDDYGLERYNVLVSTTDMEPGSFTKISDEPYMEAPTDWTEMNYDLSAYDGQNVYVAIQCVTADAFIFMVDDIEISFSVGTPEQTVDNEIEIYPNPVYNQLNISSGISMTQVDVFNQLGQKVYSQVVNGNTFKMNTLGMNSGVYYVKVTTNEGVSTRKIMVK